MVSIVRKNFCDSRICILKTKNNVLQKSHLIDQKVLPSQTPLEYCV
jgi:hypothetical protein